MDGLAITALLAGAAALALGAARGLLTLLFHLMAEPRTPIVTIHWRPLIFIIALFWFWYLTPAWAEHVIESRTISRVVQLLGR